VPIYVESFIRAPMEELWEKTQNPKFHTAWDLRFSEISYLPRADESEPQSFLYRTRIGFGLDIAGQGESRGEHQASSGTRTSALRFWSNDPKSLIVEGSGYWKYTPEADGIRFVTVYDYRPRFGAAGRIFDFLAFRPLIAWATAWSFDRLRLWLEKGLDPAASRERLIVHWTARWTLALIWMYQGLVPKLLFPDSGELAILRGSPFFSGNVRTTLAILGVAEIIFGLLHLAGRPSRFVLTMDLVALPILLMMGAVGSGQILIAPFNAPTLTAGMLALAAIALTTRRDLPSARNTVWSSRRPPK